MIRVRKGGARGVIRNSWLDARLSFSFADYRDPEYDGYSDLMVLNEDRVAPGAGFGPHGHRDIEAVTYVLSGEIEHRDNLGNVMRLRAGDVQRMTAGRGITHSEMNASAAEPEHHLQFWIRPARTGLTPSYARRHVSREEKMEGLVLLASPDGRAESLAVNQDVQVWGAVLARDRKDYRVPQGRRTYLHVARGSLQLDGHRLEAGDAAVVERERFLGLRSDSEGEFLIFDLP